MMEIYLTIKCPECSKGMAFASTAWTEEENLVVIPLHCNHCGYDEILHAYPLLPVLLPVDRVSVDRVNGGSVDEEECPF